MTRPTDPKPPTDKPAAKRVRKPAATMLPDGAGGTSVKPVARSRRTSVPASSPATVRMDPDERVRRIAELAYLKAEQRGFAGDLQEADWLEAEREIDAGNP